MSTPYPPPIKDLLESFALLDDWEDRYALLIDIGKQLPLFPDALKTDANLVRGCVSKVWMVPSVQNDIFSFEADSDAHIVKGLVGILFLLYNQCPVDRISEIDPHKLFDRLGLLQNLTPNRRNGLFAMMERIKTCAVKN